MILLNDERRIITEENFHGQNQHAHVILQININTSNILLSKTSKVDSILMDSTNKPDSVQPLVTWIPEGYVLVTGPDEQPYVVPEFCVPALHHIFDG